MASTPPPTPGARDGKPDHKPDHKPDVAMWGAPGSGKTAFLAALSIALGRAQGGKRGWRLIGADSVSTAELIRLRKTLLTDRVFPEKTNDLEYYNWEFVGPPAEGRRRWWAFWRRRTGKAPRIKLTFLDAPGERFSGEGYAIEKEALIESLTKSRGLIYLFDPDRESEKGDAFKHLDAAILEISERLLLGDDHADGKLPHYIAICVTKYDDPKVLQAAVESGLTQVEPDDVHEVLRVPDENAREFFEKMLGEGMDQDAELILSVLEQSFRQDRIRFFVTSAIGVFVDQDRGFDLDDPENIMTAMEDGKKVRKIRGRVLPINIMEPVIWLGQMLGSSGEDAK